MTTNTGFEQPRIPAGSSPRERRAQAQMAGGHSVLKELGLGTNDPERALHMVKETAGAAVLLERIQASVNSGALQSRKSRGTLDNRGAVVDDDNLLTIEGYAYVGDTNEYQETCRIEFEVDGSVSDASKGAPGRIVFRTSSGSGLTKRMRIDKDGKVGIGLDAPSTRLTVEGAVTLKEQASADADVASYGQLWVKTATPNELYFTTDAGNDIQLTSGTAMAGGDITSVVAGAGMTGGATSGAATLNVIGGDGITANADEIEATVDGSTIELSASDGSGTIRVKDNGVTLAKMAGLSRGTIIYGDASGDPAALAAGDADQVLTHDGTDISWEDAGGGSGDITAVTIQTDSGSGSKASDTSGSADFILQGDSAGIDVTNSGTTITVALDLNEITAGAVANGDSFVFVDANDGNANKKEAIADLATLFAGDGITASSSVLAVNVDDSTIETNSDAIRIKDNGVTLAKMAGLARGKIIHGDASGDPAALAVGGANTVLQSDGTDSSWGTVATAMIADNAVSLAKMAGLSRGTIIYGDASGDPAALAAGDADQVLTHDGTDVSWEDASGGGSGDVVAGSTFTTAGVIMACDGDDKTIDEPTALLTTNGQGMTVSAALATPFQVDSGARDGNSTFKFTTGSAAGTNNQASIQVIAQTAANANLYLGDTSSATRGGLKYKNNGDSMELVAAGAAVLELDSDKVVEFKIAEEDDASGTDYSYASKALKIKVNGTDYWLQLYEEAGGGGGGMGGP